MVVSTIYDKDLKQKVFQVRGSERYTNSTQTTLEIEYDNSHKSYLEVTLTSTVKRKIGSSSIVFYCDDTILGIVACNESDSEVEATYQVSYGYHKFYAKYVGNTQCLSSKSGIIELDVTEPDLPETILSFVQTGTLDSEKWIENVSNLSYKVLLEDESNNAITGKDILIYVNGEYYDTVTSASSAQALSINYSTYGKHIILKAVFEGDDDYLASNDSVEFYHNYVVTAAPKYRKTGIGSAAIVNATVTKSDGRAVGNRTVILKEGSTILATSITDSNGNVTLSKYLDDVGNHNLKVVESIMNAAIDVSIEIIGVTSITVDSDKVTSNNNTLPLTVRAYNNHIPVVNLPINITLYHSNTSEDCGEIITNSSGIAYYNYEGEAVGKVSIVADSGDVVKGILIDDTYQYFSQSQQKSFNVDYSVRNSLAVLQKYNGLEMAAADIPGYFILQGTYYQSIDDVFPDWRFEFDLIQYAHYNTLRVCGIEITYNQIKLKPHIVADKVDDTLTIYVNGTETISTSTFENRANIIVGSGAVLTIDNMKLMRL